MNTAAPTLLHAPRIEVHEDRITLTVETVEGRLPFTFTVDQALHFNPRFEKAMKEALQNKKNRVSKLFPE